MDTKTIATIAAEIAQTIEWAEHPTHKRALLGLFSELQTELRDLAGGDRAAQEAFEEATEELHIRNDPGLLPVYQIHEYATRSNADLAEMAWAGNTEAGLQLAQNLKHADAMEQGAYVVTVDIRTSDDITTARIPRL